METPVRVTGITIPMFDLIWLLVKFYFALIAASMIVSVILFSIFLVMWLGLGTGTLPFLQ